MTATVLGGLLLAAPEGLGAGRDVIAGPVPAEVVAVIDGDTVDVRARIWLGQDVATRVRLDGVDAPELKGKCEAERAQAQQAKAFVEAAVANPHVTLFNVQYGKYAGRVVADVVLADGRRLADALIAAGLVRPYGGGKRQSWC